MDKFRKAGLRKVPERRARKWKTQPAKRTVVTLQLAGEAKRLILQAKQHHADIDDLEGFEKGQSALDEAVAFIDEILDYYYPVPPLKREELDVKAHSTTRIKGNRRQ